MRKFLLLLLLLAFGLSLSATALGTEFENALRETQNPEQAKQVIANYRERLSDLSDLRILQNYWMQIEPDSCQDWFAAKHSSQQESAEYEYLWLRGQTDLAAQLSGGRLLIRSKPDFYWGYRLFSNTYSQILQDSSAPQPLREDIIANLDKDREIMLQGLKRWPLDDYLRLALFHHYSSRDDIEAAEDQLIRLSDPAAIEANFRHVFDFIEATGRIRPFELLFPQVISRTIARGEITSADSLSYFQFYYLEALKKALNWTRMSDHFEQYPQLKTDDTTLRTRIQMHIGLNQPDTALNLLEGALAADLVSYPEALADENYEPLKALARYTEVMALASANWIKNQAARKTAILGAKSLRPAPLWELPDADGKMLRLEDLRGKIVILDFWALWCSPCLQTLSKLQAWHEKNPADDLVLISINVWENPSDYEAVKNFINRQGSGVELLFGDNEVPRAYGFSAIPWICAIDKSGNIAFTLSGDSPVLAETLDVWVEELRR